MIWTPVFFVLYSLTCANITYNTDCPHGYLRKMLGRGRLLEKTFKKGRLIEGVRKVISRITIFLFAYDFVIERVRRGRRIRGLFIHFLQVQRMNQCSLFCFVLFLWHRLPLVD